MFHIRVKGFDRKDLGIHCLLLLPPQLQERYSTVKVPTDKKAGIKLECFFDLRAAEEETARLVLELFSQNLYIYNKI